MNNVIFASGSLIAVDIVARIYQECVSQVLTPLNMLISRLRDTYQVALAQQSCPDVDLHPRAASFILLALIVPRCLKTVTIRAYRVPYDIADDSGNGTTNCTAS